MAQIFPAHVQRERKIRTLMMKIFWTLLTFLLFTANFVQSEGEFYSEIVMHSESFSINVDLYFLSFSDHEEIERDEEREDNGRVDPSCLRTYGNRNCSQAQKDSAIQKYQSLRQEQLRSILANVSSSGSVKNLPKPSPNLVLRAIPVESTANNSTSSTVSSPTSSLSSSSSSSKAIEAGSSPESSSSNSSNPAFNDTALTSPTITATTEAQSNSSVKFVQNSIAIEPPSTPVSGPPTGFMACDRAYRLLQVADLFARYNAACEARVFGIAADPDFWIRRCAKAVKAKRK